MHIFCCKTSWKTHRTVDAELDKLEIALDVNDNDKSEFSESDENDEKEVHKVVISISCLIIYVKNFNTKYIFTQFHSALFRKTLSLLSTISNCFPLADLIFIFHFNFIL